MVRTAALASAFAIVLASGVSAQTPPAVAPPDKIAPEGPVRPDEPAPPSTPAPAEKAPDPLGVAANVATVRLAGVWETADGKGFSRVVGVVDGTSQRFHVQWLAEPEGAIVETKELTDDDAAKLVFGDVRAETSATGTTVFLDTLPDSDGIRDSWVLIVGAPGETRFGPATN